jgi:hypothetical protein
MNQFATRLIVGDNFEYSAINNYLSKSDIRKGQKKLENSFIKLTRNWDKEKNSEWIIRHYLATKMILSSSVMLTSLEYSINHNLLVVEPYLIYYSILNVSRAVIFTNPNTEWRGGGLIESSHSKALNIVGDSISQFNKKVGENIKTYIDKAREYRELFSYRFPANGIEGFKIEIGLENAVKICSFLAELSQLQSEKMQERIMLKKDMKFELDIDALKVVYTYKGSQFEFIDSEDRYRIDYIYRKQPFPVSLYLTMSEGMVEDFFGAWCPNDTDNTELYNPDTNWRIIFPVP